MEKYNKIVGLGYNCEISFRIKNAFGALDAQLFSWAYVSDRDKFVEALYDPKRIYSGDLTLTADNMFECNVTGIRFHPRHDVLEDDSRESTEKMEWCKNELKQRVEHLKEKHTSLMNGNNRTLFLMKILPTNEADDISFIQAVYEALKKMYLSGTYTLVIILPKKGLKDSIKQLENDILKIRTLKWFPAQKHTDIASDSRGWLKIFWEFCNVSKKEFYRREWKQKREVIPGMIAYKVKRTWNKC